jgi:RNA polymerase sigma-70 factor (ECF subfamily)
MIAGASPCQGREEGTRLARRERLSTPAMAEQDQGKADEFLALVEKYRDELYRFILKTVWDPGVAEDVFQSGVLSAYENFDKFVPGTNFRAWMYRILLNKCYVANREISRAMKPLEDVDPGLVALAERPGYGDVLEEPGRFLELCGDEVTAAFRRLSPAERSCILLRSVEGFSYQEIAEILGIPFGTVMTHLSRGRAKLRRDLLEYAVETGVIRRSAGESIEPGAAGEAANAV